MRTDEVERRGRRYRTTKVEQHLRPRCSAFAAILFTNRSSPPMDANKQEKFGLGEEVVLWYDTSVWIQVLNYEEINNGCI